MNMRTVLDVIQIGMTGLPAPKVRRRIVPINATRQTTRTYDDVDARVTPKTPEVKPRVSLEVREFNYFVDDVLQAEDFNKLEFDTYGIERAMRDAGFPVSIETASSNSGAHIWMVGSNNYPNIDMTINQYGVFHANGVGITRGSDLVAVIENEIND
jgi:hypothetical protein